MLSLAVFDPGEEPADDYLSWLHDGVYSHFMSVAKDFKGFAIPWEHRYYGESSPFKTSVKFTSSLGSNQN